MLQSVKRNWACAENTGHSQFLRRLEEGEMCCQGRTVAESPNAQPLRVSRGERVDGW
jgi:hypothetical protein